MELSSLLESTLRGLGYELVTLELSNRGRLLRVFIDKPGGVNIDDCVLVSNHLSRLLAVEHQVDYDRLEVSSPGLDRPLRKEEDFQRFAGQTAEVRMRVPVGGRKRFVGILKEIKDGVLHMDVEGSEVILELGEIDRAKLVPKF